MSLAGAKKRLLALTGNMSDIRRATRFQAPTILGNVVADFQMPNISVLALFHRKKHGGRHEFYGIGKNA